MKKYGRSSLLWDVLCRTLSARCCVRGWELSLFRRLLCGGRPLSLCFAQADGAGKPRRLCFLGYGLLWLCTMQGWCTQPRFGACLFHPCYRRIYPILYEQKRDPSDPLRRNRVISGRHFPIHLQSVSESIVVPAFHFDRRKAGAGAGF